MTKRALVLLGLLGLASCGGEQRLVVDVTQKPDGTIGVKRCDVGVWSFVVFANISVDEGTCRIQEYKP